MGAAGDHVQIRIATVNDLEGLAASSAGLFAEDAASRDPLRDPSWPPLHAAANYADHLTNSDSLVLVAVHDAAVVGHLLGGFYGVSAMWSSPRASLISMFVQAPWRGLGVGSRFVADFSAWASGKGATQLRVTAYSTNQGAVRFYRRHGFAPLESTFAADL